jgi:hypothetical protein
MTHISNFVLRDPPIIAVININSDARGQVCSTHIMYSGDNGFESQSRGGLFLTDVCPGFP